MLYEVITTSSVKNSSRSLSPNAPASCGGVTRITSYNVCYTKLLRDEVETNLSRYLVETEAGRALQLYRDASVQLLLTQEDIRQYQLAKGAVLAGVRCLLERAGLNEEEVPEVIVTGAFGHGIPHAALKRVA